MRSNEHDLRNDVGTAATSRESGRPVSHDAERPSAAAPIGAVGGAAAGATVGTITLGPIGTVIGAIAGALGGGWAALAAAAPTHYDERHDREYRTHYETDSERLADRSYESVRPAYQLGHLAARNPDYATRDFDSIEADLQQGWGEDIRAQHGDWSLARRYAREAFHRERARNQGRTQADLNMGGTETHQRPSFSDPIPHGDPNRVAGDRDVPGRGAPDGARR